MSTNDVPERVIERIRKMMRLATDAGASQGERDNALRMAHATLAKYNLDLATVNETASSPNPGKTEPRVKNFASFYGRPWARLIANAVGELMFCRYLYWTNSRAKDTTHLFIGSHANAVSAALLAEYLVTSVMREGRKRQRANGEGNAWFRSFAIGAARSIGRRCVALRDAATAAGGGPGAPIPSDPAPGSPPGSAIVLRAVYEREDEANAAYVSANVAVKKEEDVPAHDLFRGTKLDPMLEGQEYGNTVSLNRQVK